MSKEYLNKLGISGILLLVSLACNLFSPIPPSSTPSETSGTGNVVFTQAAQTVVAQQTQNSPLPTITAQQGLPTQFLPTNTPWPTSATKPVATTVSAPCLLAYFIGDMTIPDETKLSPGSEFTKIWRLKNIGTCNWTTEFDLMFASGDKMQGSTLTALPYAVRPGETVDVKVDLTAPDKPDNYLGNWQLRSNSGVPFGLGAGANVPFWVDIDVIDIDEMGEFDFAYSFCEAKWRNKADDLHCAGTATYEDGFIHLVNEPKFESGYTDNEQTLWVYVAPNDQVVGLFPSFKVQSGDNFIAHIGCIYDYKGCNVEFRLDYRIKGEKVVHTLRSWDQKYDSSIEKIDVNLTDLDGLEIEFILVVAANNNSPEHHAFWLAPHITRP